MHGADSAAARAAADVQLRIRYAAMCRPGSIGCWIGRGPSRAATSQLDRLTGLISQFSPRLTCASGACRPRA
jgi:hypothetical protein